MEELAAHPGSVVRSRAGRDAGKVYMVIRVINPRRVALADGRLRTADSPKIKNVRHLEVLGSEDHLALRLLRGERLGDSEIRQALQGYETTGSGGRQPDV